jgi:pyridinium-3,5-biscarboxylic acid mononucleotide sulfurtransferase
MSGGDTAIDFGLDRKIAALRQEIGGLDSAIVAFSAGVDSTFVAAIAAQELGDKALAVTATSPSFPERELEEAKQLAARLGIRHRVIRSNELANPNYANNPTSRCYHCKTELYGLMRQLADAEGYACILDGTNADDMGDFRPGHRAAQEQRVRGILQELGFTKADIREASRQLNLPTADKPAFACLASRFPYGVTITREALQRVEQAENILRDLGFVQLRVRVHDDVARIEVGPAEIDRFLDPDVRARISDALKDLGYSYVTLDLQGYRSGSLNEGLRKRG